jgi:uncharacterized membrane protein YhhN
MMVAGFLVMAVLVMVMLVLETRPGGSRWYGGIKIVASLWFCVVGAVVIPDVPQAPLARPLFLAALALSFVGDVLLVPKGHKRVFLVGLVAFLLAHVMFIPAFVTRGVDVATAVGAGVVIAAPAVIAIRWLRPHVKGPMLSAVAAYVVVICTMLATACGAVAEGLHRNDGVTPALLVGAIAFWCSDLFVARQRFVAPGFSNRLFGVPLYFFAQLGLIAGFQ